MYRGGLHGKRLSSVVNRAENEPPRAGLSTMEQLLASNQFWYDVVCARQGGAVDARVRAAIFVATSRVNEALASREDMCLRLHSVQSS